MDEDESKHLYQPLYSLAFVLFTPLFCVIILGVFVYMCMFVAIHVHTPITWPSIIHQSSDTACQHKLQLQFPAFSRNEKVSPSCAGT